MEQRFCPNCGSTNVEPDHRKTNMLGEMIADQDKWKCNECRYSGIMPKGEPEELEEDLENINFEPSPQPLIDTDLGKGYTKYVIYISAPLTIIYLLLIIL